MVDKKILKKWNKKYLEAIKESLKPTEKQLDALWSFDVDGSNLNKFECNKLLGESIKELKNNPYDYFEDYPDGEAETYETIMSCML